MGKIKKLSSQEAQKIAAGEVVERPANVVKELIENALDAGAKSISLYLEQAGHALIRVVDDGHGMDEEDAQLCFLEHATSKINSIDQLYNLSTFGFRGEALTSIAAVSIVHLQTKEMGADWGTSIICQEGNIIEKKEISCPIGTDISIKNLFYNVPARRKFLKTQATELRVITNIFNAFCLDYMDVHFKLYLDGAISLNVPIVESFDQRAHQILQLPHQIVLHEKLQDITINGIISSHQYYRYDRSMMFFFVNKRWVKNTGLSKSVLKGYSQVLPEGRYPAVALSITLDPQKVDINIHPRKEEVQFLHAKTIESLLHNATKKALEFNLSNQLRPKEVVREKISFAEKSFFIPSYKEQSNFSIDQTNYDQIFQSKRTNFLNADNLFVNANFDINGNNVQSQLVVGEPPAEQAAAFSQLQESQYTVIGVHNDTYIILSQQDGIVLVDQHAAHERIMYERFRKSIGSNEIVSLLFPQIITLNQEDFEIVQAYRDVLLAHGINSEPFGSSKIRINGALMHLRDVDLSAIIHEFISVIRENKHLQAEELLKNVREKMCAQMACKAAVKAGDKLAPEQINQLLKDLQTVDNRLTCPHGRPTLWTLSDYEIEKKFKRK